MTSQFQHSKKMKNLVQKGANYRFAIFCHFCVFAAIVGHCHNDISHSYLFIKIRSVCPSVSAMVSESINPLPLYPATDCAAATDISGVGGRWQLSR